MVFKWVKNWYVSKVNKPLAATAEDWADWEENTRKNNPLKYFFFETMRTYFAVKKRKIKDLKYNLSQKYLGGYHQLKLDVKRFTYPYGKEKLSKYHWMDSDTQIELFMFQILVNYIENEQGYESLKERILNDEVRKYDREAFVLYEWFINDYCKPFGRPMLDDLYSRYPNHKKYGNIFRNNKNMSDDEKAYNKEKAIIYGRINDHDEKMNKEMTENLIRLVNIRGSLWT
jgi:hypothetical protein